MASSTNSTATSTITGANETPSSARSTTSPQNARLLFFDELHVHDSGDARLLTRLLDHVFQRGLTVLATSNYAPDDLLPNPIWHHIFEPGIALIKTHMDVWNLLGPVDYRTVTDEHGHGFAAGTWTMMPARSDAPERHTPTVVNGRSFAVTSVDGGMLVATFDQLCSAATSTVEYLDWARSFSRWAITDIPPFGSVDAEAQQRFVNVVDVLVDADISVRFSSVVDLATFLADASERPDAFRMASRLQLLATTTQPSGRHHRGSRAQLADPTDNPHGSADNAHDRGHRHSASTKV